METYNIAVECEDDAESRTVKVQTEASTESCDADMFASEIESCLEEQHGLVIGENLLQWEIV